MKKNLAMILALMLCMTMGISAAEDNLARIGSGTHWILEGRQPAETPTPEPVATPEPEITPEPDIPQEKLIAQPITDANADLYLGKWYVNSIVMSGEVYAPDDFGLEMIVEFGADGYATLTQGEETDRTVWKMEDGNAMVSLDHEFFNSMELLPDGTLSVTEGEEALILSRSGAKERENLTDPAATAFIGTWTNSMLDRSITLELNGRATMTLGDETSQTVWNCENGQAVLNLGPKSSVPMEIQNGTLVILADNVTLTFVKEDSLNVEPTPAVTEAPVVPDENPGATRGMEERLGRKYVCKTYTTAGCELDASTLMFEYSVTFEAGGDVQMVIAGQKVAGLKWVMDDEGVHVTYFDDTDWLFQLTENGFDLNFYDSMMMHMLPEE